MYRRKAEAAVLKSDTNMDFQDQEYITRVSTKKTARTASNGACQGDHLEVSTRSWSKHLFAIVKYIITLCNTANFAG